MNTSALHWVLLQWVRKRTVGTHAQVSKGRGQERKFHRDLVPFDASNLVQLYVLTPFSLLRQGVPTQPNLT